MERIYIKNICGKEILSRANIKKVYEFITELNETIDFEGINFISRSVADEICNITENYPEIKITGLKENLINMIEIVKNGRSKPRSFRRSPKISVTVRCETMDDLRNAIYNF